MSPSGTDRNLLFGIMALQMDFIDRDRLIEAMNIWVLEKTKALGAILVERGGLSESRRTLLESLVDEHVTQHGGDPQRSLAALTSLDSARAALEAVADPDLQASLDQVTIDRSANELTLTESVPIGRSTRPDNDATASIQSSQDPSHGRFRILRPHAKGGLGAVFVAQDGELNRQVALKQIQPSHADRPESRSRFLLEAEVTGGLEHPGIVPVYSLGHDPDGRPFYAMRFIEGDSLKGAIDRFHAPDAPRDPGPRALELQKLLRRFLDVCEAIAYAHSRGVLHRDLKPGNIMVGRYGETLVVDWGLAKVVGRPDDSGEATLHPSASGSSSETLPGSAVGTPSYMSPEQANGQLDQLGPRSDVYSLGATLYALLTGRPPVDGPDVFTVLDRVCRGDVPRPRHVHPEVPEPLDAVCRKAMALDPSERYASPLDLAADIESWLADEPVSAWPEPLLTRARRWIRNHQRLVSGAAAAILSGFLALAALTIVITVSNRWLDEANNRLAGANSRIVAQNTRITSQNQQLEQINRDLERARSRAERQRDQAESVTDFLVSGFQSPDPARDGRTITIAEILSRSVEDLRERGNLAPDTRASILGAIGESYIGLGLLAESVDVLREARDLHVEAIGPDHPDTLAVQNELADAYRASGRLDEAVDLFEQTLRARRAVLGNDHPDTLATQNDLAVAYEDAGQLDEAIPLLEATLRAKRAALGDDHPNLLVSQHNLASTYYAAGRLEEAISLQEATLKAARAQFGDDHPGTLASQTNLAAFYEDAGRLDESIPLLEATLRAKRAALGNDHPSTLTSQNNLANHYYEAGRLDEAITLFEQTRRARRDVLGEAHPNTLNSTYNLAAVHLKSGHPAEAEPLLLDIHHVLSERANSLPAELRADRHRQCLKLLVQVYDSWDKPDEARRWRRILETEQTDPGVLSLPDDVFARPASVAPGGDDDGQKESPTAPSA